MDIAHTQRVTAGMRAILEEKQPKGEIAKASLAFSVINYNWSLHLFPCWEEKGNLWIIPFAWRFRSDPLGKWREIRNYHLGKNPAALLGRRFTGRSSQHSRFFKPSITSMTLFIFTRKVICYQDLAQAAPNRVRLRIPHAVPCSGRRCIPCQLALPVLQLFLQWHPDTSLIATTIYTCNKTTLSYKRRQWCEVLAHCVCVQFVSQRIWAPAIIYASPEKLEYCPLQ